MNENSQPQKPNPADWYSATFVVAQPWRGVFIAALSNQERVYIHARYIKTKTANHVCHIQPGDACCVRLKATPTERSPFEALEVVVENGEPPASKGTGKILLWHQSKVYGTLQYDECNCRIFAVTNSHNEPVGFIPGDRVSFDIVESERKGWIATNLEYAANVAGDSQ